MIKHFRTITTFVKQGADEKVDDCVKRCVDSKDQLICIKEAFNSILVSYEKKTSKDFIKIHETATLGTSLTTTQRRSIILKRKLKILLNQTEISIY